MRKECLLLLMLCWTMTLSAQYLHEGATIATISPSSATDTTTINGGIQTLEKWGYHCVVGQHALADYHGFAGTIEERLEDLLWALREPSIKAIMCSRGGDGAAHLLSRLSLDTLRQYPKMIIGFSDITALLCAEARAGVKGIHGSMCHALKTYEGNDTVSQTLRRMLQGDLPTYRIAPHPLNIEGRAEGIIVGGNLSVYNDLAGSDFDPLMLQDIILFMEDTRCEVCFQTCEASSWDNSTNTNILRTASTICTRCSTNISSIMASPFATTSLLATLTFATSLSSQAPKPHSKSHQTASPSAIKLLFPQKTC